MGFDAFGIVDKLAAVLDPEGWVLVGGLMVHAHALLAGLQSNRFKRGSTEVIDLGASMSNPGAIR